jgi:hypothetical protein
MMTAAVSAGPPNRINRFFLLSFLLHASVGLGAYIYFNFTPEAEHYVATVALYMGEGETDRPTTGKGKGDKNADKNQKKDDSIGTGQSASNVDWGTASDPSVEGGSRYAPDIWIDGNLEDFYPPRARQSNLGKVTVALSLYFDSKGQVRDVRIRYVRSAASAHKPFEADFIQAARQVALTKMRLRSAGYKKDGRSVDFVWDTAINFTLQ